MASAFQTRKNAVVKAIRVTRQWYRRADTAGERVERELDRLIKRKTGIAPESLLGLQELFRTYLTTVEAIQQRITDAMSVSNAL